MTTATYAPRARPRAHAPSRLMLLAESRALIELASFYVAYPLLAGSLPRGDGHPVLVLPGFLADDRSTSPMRRLLGKLGYDVHGWDLGRNVRVDNARIEQMSALLGKLHRQSGRKVSIIGWSLGGVFARELAKLHPQSVRQVISLGSPITNDRSVSNASKTFKHFNGERPEPIQAGKFNELHKAPPVPTTSILTRSDGIVHWRGSVQQPGGQTENIQVRASHIGLGFNPSVMVALADRLSQPEGAWNPFEPRLAQRWMFPQRNLH